MIISYFFGDFFLSLFLLFDFLIFIICLVVCFDNFIFISFTKGAFSILHRLSRLGAALMLSLFLFSATPTYAWHFHGDPVHDAENINLEKKILEQVK